MTEVCTQCENMASDIVVVGGAVLKGTDGECVAEIMNAGPWCSRSLAQTCDTHELQEDAIDRRMTQTCTSNRDEERQVGARHLLA